MEGIKTRTEPGGCSNTRESGERAGDAELRCQSYKQTEHQNSKRCVFRIG